MEFSPRGYKQTICETLSFYNMLFISRDSHSVCHFVSVSVFTESPLRLVPRLMTLSTISFIIPLTISEGRGGAAGECDLWKH